MRRTIFYASLAFLIASGGQAISAQKSETAGQNRGTCTGIFPSYWQDPAEKFLPMWEGQIVSNAPPKGWKGPVFRLSDAYPIAPDHDDEQPWRASRFDPLFLPSTDEQTPLRKGFLLMKSEDSWGTNAMSRFG